MNDNGFKDVFIPLKVFSKKEYADDFLSGKLYLNTLKYFIELEDNYKNNIGDPLEGISARLYPQDMKLNISFPEIDGAEAFTLTEKELAGPSFIRFNVMESLNVFCFTLLSSGGVLSRLSSDDINEDYINSLYAVDSKKLNEEIGEHAVVIFNTGKFFERMKDEISRLKSIGEVIISAINQVNYLDDSSSRINTFTEYPDLSHAFNKSDTYRDQRECRLVVKVNDQVVRGRDDSYTINIGDLSDIGFYIPTEKLKDIRLNLPGK